MTVEWRLILTMHTMRPKPICWMGESLFAESLNGIWKFHYARNYGAVIRGFEKEEYCCSSWDDIRVPAHIQMEGYDVPQYANTQYPWEGREDIRPGEIPEYLIRWQAM